MKNCYNRQEFEISICTRNSLLILKNLKPSQGNSMTKAMHRVMKLDFMFNGDLDIPFQMEKSLSLVDHFRISEYLALK